jgi:formate-dependent nitrite reductase membrane component NrfD
MWSEQRGLPSGHPSLGSSAAAAIVSYDIGHRAPWDWRVSLYTWTKGIAAGAYLVAAVLALAGALAWDGDVWRWAAPLVAAGALAATGAVLIGDLEQPRRFHYILLRPQWRSWLARGAVVISLYAALLGLHLLGSLLGLEGLTRWLVPAGIPLAVLAAVYTAFLLAQAKARDLWQSPLLPPHLLVQSSLAGAAVLLPFASSSDPLRWLLAGAAIAHLVFVLGEVTLTHPTAHAHLAVRELTRGRYAGFFWAGAALVAVAVAAPWIGVVAIPFALAGLLAYEHAYVQAGQAVPLA